jgi:glutamate 5-kinase
MSRDELLESRRLVVKVGTSTITHGTGKVNLYRMERLVREIADLRNQGRDVLLVSSGAVGSGIGVLDYPGVPATIPLKQALAAVGQGTLLHIYEKLFGEYGIKIAQILLTRDVFDDRMRYLNARNTMLTLLEMGVVPIINENDTVAVEELKFGDNDRLSAMVACSINADLLVILSDIDGFYDRDPRSDNSAKLVSEINEITSEMEENSKSRGSSFSSGGMVAKLVAARMTMASAIPMVIANAGEKDVLRRVLQGEQLGTLFVPKVDTCQARKRWIGFGTISQGTLFVDDGASKALLKKGKSLLPSGIASVKGDFDRGAVVTVCTSEGKSIAKGIVNYSSEEIEKIAGKRSSEIEKVLEQKDYDEVIHRDNLIML